MSIAIAGLEPPARLSFEQPLSAEEFWQICVQNPDLRLERSAAGELLVMTPTGLRGSGHELDVASQLHQWALQDGRGRAYGSNAGITLPDSSVRAADACWVSWTKLKALTPEQYERFAPVCPEFVIEVVSRSDSLPVVREKMRQWIANGVELAWLIDPERRAVEISRPGRQPEMQEGHSAVYGEGSVAGFVLELGRVWG